MSLFQIKPRNAAILNSGLFQPQNLLHIPQNGLTKLAINLKPSTGTMTVHTKCCLQLRRSYTFPLLNLLHSERPKLYTILAFLSAIGLIV